MTGANGKEAQQKAVDDFVASPATKYLVDTGTENALRNSSRAGTTASGQTLIDLNNVAQGQALQNWNNTVQSLQPYLSASTAAAAGSSGVSTTQAGTNYDAAKAKAGYDWNTETGVGNAEANYELSKNNSGANIWSAIMGAAGLVSGGAGLTGAVNNIGKAASTVGSWLPGGTSTQAAPTGWSQTQTGVPNWALSK